MPFIQPGRGRRRRRATPSLSHEKMPETAYSREERFRSPERMVNLGFTSDGSRHLRWAKVRSWDERPYCHRSTPLRQQPLSHRSAATSSPSVCQPSKACFRTMCMSRRASDCSPALVTLFPDLKHFSVCLMQSHHLVSSVLLRRSSGRKAGKEFGMQQRATEPRATKRLATGTKSPMSIRSSLHTFLSHLRTASRSTSGVQQSSSSEAIRHCL